MRLVVFDVDGVLTDGSLFFGDDGEEYKAFHARDGQGMAMLREAGAEIGGISGRAARAGATGPSPTLSGCEQPDTSIRPSNMAVRGTMRMVQLAPCGSAAVSSGPILKKIA